MSIDISVFQSLIFGFSADTRSYAFPVKHQMLPDEYDTWSLYWSTL